MAELRVKLLMLLMLLRLRVIEVLSLSGGHGKHRRSRRRVKYGWRFAHIRVQLGQANTQLVKWVCVVLQGWQAENCKLLDGERAGHGMGRRRQAECVGCCKWRDTGIRSPGLRSNKVTRAR